MSYRPGQTVIVTRDEVNHVGVVLDRYLINKAVVYDVLLENRSAFTMINTSKNKQIFINKELTTKLCESGAITPTMNYNTLFEDNLLPIVRG